MSRSLLTFLLICCTLNSHSQTLNELPASSKLVFDHLKRIAGNEEISADSTFTLLSDWNQYPLIKEVNKWYLFIYKDPVFGPVPLKIFIPGNYRNDVPAPAVLILHGAVVLSSFKDAYKDTAADEDQFYQFFSGHQYIVVRPYADSYGPHADGTINFDWVVNRFNGRTYRNKTNPTYGTLVAIFSQLKQVLNIDDNKVFAFGHSDGADGVFALDVYKPSLFAGFVVYNSMLTTLGDYDIYIRNTINRPLYLVHSDLDNLRPIQQTRSIVKIVDSLNSPVLYKEYIGYQHFDKHLQLDLPYSYTWMKGISRNPFQKSITWEMSDSSQNTCDWLRVTAFDTSLPSAAWHTQLNTKLYLKTVKQYLDQPYYRLNRSVAVRAYYNNNTFELSTSGVTEVELLISPVMVNLQNPIVIKVNGHEVFNKRVAADKVFLLNQYASTFDRKAIWVTAIKIKTS